MIFETTAIAFVAGAVIGAAARSMSSFQQKVPPPPPPPPFPPNISKKPKTRIFYRMKSLPIDKNGEDTLVREEDSGFIVDKPILLESPPKITEKAIAEIVLKEAPPLMSVEQKRDAFFQGPTPVHVELLQRHLQRLQTLQPQQ